MLGNFSLPIVLRVTDPRSGENIMIICADDYGLSEDIDAAILELARRGKLSAVSCMAAFAACDGAAFGKLLAHRSTLDVGLHLCLTHEEQPLSEAAAGEKFPSFGKLLRRSLTGGLPLPEIRRQISLQYELFVQKSGITPDYVDGHCHVHQFPGIREALIEFVRALPAQSRPYIRNTCQTARELRRRQLPWLKASFIGAFGKRMRRRLLAASIPTNDGFAGIYDFNGGESYAELFPRFGDCLSGRNGILVTHPGTKEAWRKQEFATLLESAMPANGLNRFQR